ncbi:hypothetical protein QYM36_008033 [Artemia franciscana]|uniref:CDK5RAP1-like protein n=1 Tax=Artemia franciscana TaxID=6661 RepID=A0AA88IEV5_ARTSF|nr:hypothetical protein QYM36_008033 [Artemia franciscana]
MLGLKNFIRLYLQSQKLQCCYTVSMFSTKQPKNKVTVSSQKEVFKIGPTFQDFLENSLRSAKNANKYSAESMPDLDHAYLKKEDYQGKGQKVYMDVYGCQMNVNDVEIVWSVLISNGYQKTNKADEADVILLMTCAIREGAEQKIWNRLDHLRHLKKRKAAKNDRRVSIGVLGCMAERLKEKLIEKERSIDIVAGPDSYRDLPRLLTDVTDDPHQSAVNVLLSLEETYADIIPVRVNPESPSAFISIMRGCDNMCSYCIVPFTRGRERSRPADSIINEVRYLADEGIKEITLLGQNVNSYRDLSDSVYYGGISDKIGDTSTVPGFKTVYKAKKGGRRFADLLEKISSIVPNIRIRFTSPHPKDFPDEVLQLIAERSNICKNLHLPAQSGNNAVLERMNRGYTRESYLQLVQRVNEIIPGVTLSSDFICGFCGETEDEFQDTLTLVERVQYQTAYIFPYSMREKTKAHRRLEDNISHDVKTARVDQLVSSFRDGAEKLNQSRVGSVQLVLIEGVSE